MYSMTGYGRAEYKGDGITFVVEIKSVNNRNLDITAKLPRALIGMEDALRAAVKERVARGKIDLYVSFQDLREKEKNFSLDTALAKAYFDAGERIASSLNLKNDCTVSRLLSVPDVIRFSDDFVDYSEFTDVLVKTTADAVDAFNRMRKTEGEKLYADISSRMATISTLVDTISDRAPNVVSEYREKLSERIKEALSDVCVDEARLLNEVAFFADKANIDEELTRLHSHISQFYGIVKEDECGKKLDFLIQEFNRETNTICSKANDLAITDTALKLKNEIEKIREQIQNLE